MLGKLSRLPAPLREQLNVRLANAQPAEAILSWLNGLPEVQAILNDQFEGKPINEVNLTEYRQRAFRRWEMRRSALEFSSEASADVSAPGQPPAGPLVDQLVRWIALRFAAAAQSSPMPDDPEIELRQVRQFLADIVALRRGDLVSRRIQVEQQRLAINETKNDQFLERRFWEWTRRPDIQAKLYPHRDPEKTRRDVLRMLDRELLGIKRPEEADSDPDPAACI